MNALKLSEHFSMPAIDYAGQGNAILGIRDAGKTYTAMKVTEENEPDNPIYRVVSDIIMRQVVIKDEAQTYILDRLDQLSSQISQLNVTPTPNSLKQLRTYMTIFREGVGVNENEIVHLLRNQSDNSLGAIGFSRNDEKLGVTLSETNPVVITSLIEKITKLGYQVEDVHVD